MADRIDEIVGEKAFQQFDLLLDKLDSSRSKFAENIKAALQLNTAIGGAKSFKDYAKTVEDAEKKLIQLRNEQIKLEKSELQLQQKRDQITARQLANDQKSSKSITEQSRLYVQLSKTLEKLRADAQDVGARFGENSVQFQKAGERVRALDARLKSIDQQLGKSQRFVGEYERAGTTGFNRIGNSINQLTRELPAFTFSIQTGFLALSNNLPIFFDEIQRIKQEVIELRKEGKEVPGVLKQIVSGFFSWMTVLSIAITLATIFAKEIGAFVKALFSGKEALDKFAISQKAVADGLSDSSYATAIKNVTELKNNIQLAKEGFISKEGVLKQYNDTIGKTTGEVKSLDEAEKAINKNAPAYIRFTFLKSVAQVASQQAAEKAVEIAKEQAKADKEYLTGYQKFLTTVPALGKSFLNQQETIQRIGTKTRNANIKGQQEEKDALLKIFDDYNKEAAELAKSAGFDFFGGGDGNGNDTRLRDALELNRAQLEITKEGAEAILSDQTRSMQDRLSALASFRKASRDLIENDVRLQLSQENLTADKIKAIRIKANSDLLKIDTDTRNKEFQIRKEANDKEVAENERLFNLQIEQAKKADKALLDQMSLAVEQRQALLNEGAERELLALAKSYSDGEITAEQYAQKRVEIQRQLNAALINEEVRNIEVLIALQKAAGKDTSDNEKKLSELKQRLSKDATDAQITDLEKLAEREKELISKRKEIAQEFGNFAIAIVQAQFQESENQLKIEGEQIDIKKARDIEAVERSLATEEDKANKIAIINARAQSQKEAIDRRQRQLDLDRARFEKAAGIARIIVDTASAVAQALPNIPLSVLVGALGAAQLATAIATPLPKFEDGGIMPYTGLAEYGHGTELRIDPDGKVSLTSSTPEQGIVKKGTEFISNKDLMSMFARPQSGNFAGAEKTSWADLIEAQKKTSKDVVSAVLSLKQGKQRGVGYYSTIKGQQYYQRNN